jgi:uncharacterized cupin superfamily protein
MTALEAVIADIALLGVDRVVHGGAPTRRSPYVGYDAPGQHPFLYSGPIDPRLPPIERVESISVGAEGPPLHAHANEDEAWYGLEGQLRFKLDAEMRHAPAGSFVFVPRGTQHCFQNVGVQQARILVMFTPARMERSLIASPRFPRVLKLSRRSGASATRWAWRSSRHRWPSPILCRWASTGGRFDAQAVRLHTARICARVC